MVTPMLRLPTWGQLTLAGLGIEGAPVLREDYPGSAGAATEDSDGEVEVFGLGAADTLRELVSQQAEIDAREADKLRAVTHYADLHRVEVGTELGGVDPAVAALLPA